MIRRLVELARRALGREPARVASPAPRLDMTRAYEKPSAWGPYVAPPPPPSPPPPPLAVRPKPVLGYDPSALIPEDYWPMLAKIESGNRPYVKAPTSSASGLYQFIYSTWVNEGGQWGRLANGKPDLTRPFGGLRPSVEEQNERARTFTAKNAKALAGAGVPVNKASLYAAHFLGVGGAIRILRAGVDDKLRDVTVANQRTANPSILGGERTVADFLSWLHRKTGEWAK